MSDLDCAPTAYGPCAPYLTLAEADELGCCDLDLTDEAIAAEYTRALLYASRRIFEASGRVYTGCCEATIRPCRSRCEPGSTLAGSLPDELLHLFPPAVPTVVGEDANGPLLMNCWLCSCDADPCSCRNRSRLEIPLVPVRSIEEVSIDGTVLDASAYRLRPGTNIVVRLDGEAWPTCQDPDGADDADGVWWLRVRYGYDLPPEAEPLVAAYACQLTKRCLGGDCDLAPEVRVISRPGVEYAVMDTEYRSRGLTGYGPVDDWILLLRGGHTTVHPRMYVPKVGGW